MADAADVVMATRDGSWFNYPSQNRFTSYHVVVEGYVSACMGLPLVEESEVNPHRLDSGLYCQRRACKNRWLPAVELRDDVSREVRAPETGALGPASTGGENTRT